MKIKPNKTDKEQAIESTSDKKLLAIKKQIQDGTYKVDLEKLAQKILESGVLDD